MPGQKAPVGDAKANPPSPNHEKVRLSFEHYEGRDGLCLSNCEAEEIRTLLACLRKLTERTWQQLLEGSSKDPAKKTGLNSTPYGISALQNPDIWPARISRDDKIIGVRGSGKPRVFGVRIGAAFYVIWFDRGHSVVNG